MGIMDRVRSWFTGWLLQEGGPEYTTYYDRVELMRSYRAGKQRPQIKVKYLQPDDNLTINFCSLIVDRTVSLLFGNGIEFDMGEEDTKEVGEDGKKVVGNKQAYVDAVMDANKQEILFHRAGILGSESGDCYIKIVPGGIEHEGVLYPRLIVLDPMLMRMECDPQDFEKITSYNISYNAREQGREVAYWERTQHKGKAIYTLDGKLIRAGLKDDKGQDISDDSMWEVVTMKSNDASSGKWVVIEPIIPWEYNFPPIVHWQNLPNPVSANGVPDLTDDVRVLQDSINFSASNIRKIIRLHAQPTTIGKGFNATKVDVEPGKMLLIPADADVKNLEMQSDLSSSNAFLLMLRQALFDITRTVDISSMADKLGALTNFGLRVLYADALFKLGTKRELYGDGIEELVRRLLILNGMDEDPGEIIWPDMLPENDVEKLNTQRQEMDLKLKSPQTVASERGIDFEKEQVLLSEVKDNSASEDEMIARLINRGQT
jgi:hypothetical protein